MSEDKAIALGHPSYVWRRGQDRRLDLIRRHVSLQDQRILDVGCGLGMYVEKFRRYSGEVYGVDIDQEKVEMAQKRLPNISLAPAEDLPFKDRSFDVTLLHEVIEHVIDDRRAIGEAVRCTDVGGHVIIYAPNRLYPMETHGFYFRGQYHFRLLPLVNYLPDPLRDQFCPHVRVYTARDIRQLFAGLPVRFVVLTHIYPGFDNVVARRPTLGGFLQRATDVLEKTPLRALGISHFVVAQRTA
ncbi:MAG: class I SAM-dependent methyltransferase [Chloroflexota bacterium]